MVSKKISINMMNASLKEVMNESNNEIIKARNQMSNNLCNECGDNCILSKYKSMIKDDPTMLEILPKKGEIYSKIYQCNEILEIMEE